MLAMMQKGCVILFLTNGGVFPQQWAKMEVKDPALCAGLLTTLGILTDPENEKKSKEELNKLTPWPYEQAPEKK